MDVKGLLLLVQGSKINLSKIFGTFGVRLAHIEMSLAYVEMNLADVLLG